MKTPSFSEAKRFVIELVMLISLILVGAKIIIVEFASFFTALR